MEKDNTTIVDQAEGVKKLFRPQKIIIGCIGFFFIVTWILLFRHFTTGLISSIDLYEYSQWETAHDRSKTAILVRNYSFDMNFILFIMDTSSPKIPDDFNDAIWISHDYDPDTYLKWREDVEWSGDSTIVAVIIEGEYVFAYDLTTKQKFEDPAEIKNLLEARELPHSTPIID